jgi:4-methyl-5(b-hydroxyethyl)-thiazole monophosphate biosynthesis
MRRKKNKECSMKKRTVAALIALAAATGSAPKESGLYPKFVNEVITGHSGKYFRPIQRRLCYANPRRDSMPKKTIVLLADGFEEVEAITPVDYLRRAGVEVTTAAIGGSLTVTGARGIPVVADAVLGNLVKEGKAGAAFWDAVVIPGGMPGAANLAASKEAGALIKEMAVTGKWVCAICASPAVVLSPLGLLSGKNFTCYPGMEEKARDGTWSEDQVVVDGSIITSRGAGTAGAFAVAIISGLLGAEAGKKVARSVLLQGCAPIETVYRKL